MKVANNTFIYKTIKDSNENVVRCKKTEKVYLNTTENRIDILEKNIDLLHDTIVNMLKRLKKLEDNGK
jgi:prefoldin subunit 5